MPIGNCGFPPVFPIQNADGTPGFQLGMAALLQRGPTIQVEVGFDPGLFQPDPALVQASVAAIIAAPIPGPNFKLVDALIDTGAGESCIDEDLAQELNLPLIDQGTCSGVHGQDILNVYLGYIRIPSISQLRYGRFLGAKLKAGGQSHQTLIGRAQMTEMILIYDGRTGTASLSV